MENKVIAKEYVKSNFIEKYKVIKLKGKIHKLLDNNGITRGYQLIIDGYFNELLEDK
jgi:hypothetical protein